MATIKNNNIYFINKIYKKKCQENEMPRLLTLRVSADEFTYGLGLRPCNNRREPILLKTLDKIAKIKKPKIDRRKKIHTIVSTKKDSKHQRLYDAIFCVGSDDDLCGQSNDVDISLSDRPLNCDRFISLNSTNESKPTVTELKRIAIAYSRNGIDRMQKDNTKIANQFKDRLNRKLAKNIVKQNVCSPRAWYFLTLNSWIN